MFFSKNDGNESTIISDIKDLLRESIAVYDSRSDIMIMVYFRSDGLVSFDLENFSVPMSIEIYNKLINSGNYIELE